MKHFRLLFAAVASAFLFLVVWQLPLPLGQQTTDGVSARMGPPAPLASGTLRATTAVPPEEGSPIASPAPAEAPRVTAEPTPAQRDPFAAAEWMQTREEPVGVHHLRRESLARLPGETTPVRIEETWTIDPAGTPIEQVEQHSMLAGQVLVDVTEEALEALQILATRYGYRPQSGEWKPGFIVLTLPEASLEAVPEAMSNLAELAEQGVTVEPDYLHFPTRTPNDPSLWRQWGVDRIEARGAWTHATGTRDVVVAVIDSGVAQSHPDLAANLHPRGRDFFAGNYNPEDVHGHGTHIAGIIGAVGNNGAGVAGVNWHVSVMALRVGDGTFATSRIIQALDYVVELKVKEGVNVVATNNSYGTTSTSDHLRRAIERTRDAGILFVAAAGNESTNMDVNPPSYPAAYPTENIISVASTSADDQLSSFSNYSRNHVHLAAPGSGIHSTVIGGGYGNMSGTSMAAPFVAGAVALISSAAPDLTWRELKERILSTVDPVPALAGKTATGGRLNLRRAVEESVTEPPTVRILSPASPSVRLPGPELSLHLKAEAAGAAVSWKLIKGAGAVSYSPAHDDGVFAKFEREGDYLLQAIAPVGEASPSEVLLVRVGPGDVLTAGLGGFWKFSEASGKIARDSSSAGADATLMGNTSWTAGQMGGAVHLDGVNSRVDFSRTASQQVTISAWVRSQSRGTTIFPRIVEGPEHILFFGRDETGSETANRGTVKFFAGKTQTDGIWYSPPFSIRDGEWYHVTATYDGTSVANEPRIYVNGRSLDVAAQEAPSGNRSASGTAWSIGNTRTNSRPWHGLVDEVRIYDRILSPEEVQALVKEVSTRSAPGLTIEVPPTVKVGHAIPFSASFAGNPWPAEGVVTRWSQLSGPAPVLFDPAHSLSTAARFEAAGAYVLRLEVQHEGLRVARSIRVEVEAAVALPQLEISADRHQTLRNTSFPVELRVTSPVPLASPLTFQLVVEGDAQAGVDFEPLPTEITLPAGETTVSFPLIPLPGDTPASSSVLIRLAVAVVGFSTASVAEIQFSPYSFSSWQAYVFSHEAGVLSGPLDDPDGNGISNLLKYAFATTAGDASSGGRDHLPRAGMVDQGGEKFLSLTYRRPVGASDLKYLAEALSGNGKDWQPVTVEETRIPLGNGLEEIIAQDTVPLSTTATRLLRLRVLLVESSPHN
jgi:subtilisin family serine protease